MENKETVLIKMLLKVEKKIEDLNLKEITIITLYEIVYYSPKIEEPACSRKPIDSGEPTNSGEPVGNMVFIYKIVFLAC